jgi:hypothetical protein
VPSALRRSRGPSLEMHLAGSKQVRTALSRSWQSNRDFIGEPGVRSTTADANSAGTAANFVEAIVGSGSARESRLFFIRIIWRSCGLLRSDEIDSD